MRKSEKQRIIDAAMSVDSLFWANEMNLQLRSGVQFSLKGRPYLCEFTDCDKRVINIKKGTQVGATTAWYIDAIHACLYQRYNQNIIYMMPTVKQVETLAKVSFDPILDYNPWLKEYVGTNTASSKEINSRSIVFVGARSTTIGSLVKDSVNLRSIPADCVIRDEVDMMEQEMIEISKQRLNASDIRREINFASPTIPGYGIDALYEASDQRRWMIKCRHCEKDTCLAETFPDCVKMINGTYRRVCVHCGKEIRVKDGRWVAKYPDRREAGFWVSGLLSPTADLDEYMYRYEHTDGSRRSEFLRSILGIATEDSECQLTKQVVLDACGVDGILMFSENETVMGVDVGNKLHAVVGVRTGKDTYKVLNVSEHTSFGSVHDLAKRMRVKCAVIDAMPDIHSARDFQKNAGFRVYLCQYPVNFTPVSIGWDEKAGIVKVNRTEWCDRVYQTFVDGKIEIPRISNDIREYASQMTKTIRRTVEHPDTGIPKAQWVKRGDDHYFHATLYFLLAAQRALIQRSGMNVKRFTHAKNKFAFRC